MIYLDANATWPLLDEVREAMLPWLGPPANASSPHGYGREAAGAVERARDQVAALAGRPAAGEVFTSGATEANHLGIRGLARSRPGSIWLGPVEHPCASAAASLAAEEAGITLVRGGVDAQGRVVLGGVPEDLGGAVLQLANHETGVLQPVGPLRAACRARGAWLHVDAAQAAGRVALGEVDADALVLSAHKLGGPVGVGALVLRDGAPFPALFPGIQERGRRAGTVAVAGVVGFGAACAAAARDLEARTVRWAALQARLDAGLRALGARVVGEHVPRVGTTTCAVLPEGVSGDLAVQVLDLEGIAVSTGAACASGSAVRSPTLRAMQDPGADRALRVSFSASTLPDDVDALLAALARLVAAVGIH